MTESKCELFPQMSPTFNHVHRPPLHLNKVINMIPSKNVVEFIDHILNESAII